MGPTVISDVDESMRCYQVCVRVCARMYMCVRTYMHVCVHVIFDEDGCMRCYQVCICVYARMNICVRTYVYVCAQYVNVCAQVNLCLFASFSDVDKSIHCYQVCIFGYARALVNVCARVCANLLLRRCVWW